MQLLNEDTTLPKILIYFFITSDPVYKTNPNSNPNLNPQQVKNARMKIPQLRFIISKLKIFRELNTSIIEIQCCNYIYKNATKHHFHCQCLTRVRP